MSLAGAGQQLAPVPSVERGRFPKLLDLSKAHLATIVGVLTGHSPIGGNVKILSDAYCRVFSFGSI